MNDNKSDTKNASDIKRLQQAVVTLQRQVNHLSKENRRIKADYERLQNNINIILRKLNG